MIRASAGRGALAALLVGAIVTWPVASTGSTTAAPDGGERAAAARAAADSQRGEPRGDVSQRRQVAESTTYDDPTGDVVRIGETPQDNTPASEPRADLVRGGAAYDAGGIDLSAEVASFTDPATDPGWREGRSSLLWLIDTEADGTADYEVVYYADDTRTAVQVFVPGNRDAPLCDASGLVDGVTYRVADLPASCLGSPASFVSYVSMNYDADPATPGTELYGDVAPDDVYAAPVGPAGGPGRETGRLAGPDRFASSAAISRAAFPDGAPIVYLARADEPADALSGGSLRDGPVLLVPSCGALPAVIGAEIARLDPRRILALGGSNAVCDDVVAQAAAA